MSISNGEFRSFSFQANRTHSNFCSPVCHINLCQNGGTLESMFPTDYKTPRFKCHCPPGYAGNLCQNVVKSCRSYNNGSQIPGLYKIFDNNMELFDVYCDFDFNSSLTWTLIQSYQLQNNSLFLAQPFTKDFPINQNTPRWEAYRLSKSRMQSIQADSGKFRVTCNYNTDGVVYRDYLQASNVQMDFLSEVDFITCLRVEWIDVRGESCKNCTAKVHQHWNNIFHFDPYQASGCDFQPSGSKSCAGSGEDNFGFYECVNTAHRCTSSPSATTQTWFGSE